MTLNAKERKKEKQMLLPLIVWKRVREIQRKKTGRLYASNPPVLLGNYKKAKYGFSSGRDLPMTAWGDGFIAPLEQLVLLTLAIKDTNYWSDLMR